MAKLTSKVIYRALDPSVADWAAARDFRRAGAGRWTRVLPHGLTFELMFQCDKNGPGPDGNELTLNLVVHPETAGGPLVLHARYGEMLDDADLQVLVEIHHRITAKVPDNEDDADFDPRTSSDPWLRVVEVADLDIWWKEFLEPRLDNSCGRVFDSGGATPTPLTRTGELESLELRGAAGWSTISISAGEAPTFARELAALTTTSPMFSVVLPSAHVIVERAEHSRSGGVGSELLGLAKHRRVWIRLGPKALDEVASPARAARIGDVVLLESSHLTLSIRA